MTTTVTHREIALLPTYTSSTGSPYVCPNFLRHFRSVEENLRTGRQLQLLSDQVLCPGWSTADDMQAMFKGFEHRVQLQFLHSALTTEKPLFERAIDELGRKLDSHFNKCAEANSPAGWLQDGVKINVVKARALHDALNAMLQKIGAVLEATEEDACEARRILTHEANKAASGGSSWTPNLGLEDSELMM